MSDIEFREPVTNNTESVIPLKDEYYVDPFGIHMPNGMRIAIYNGTTSDQEVAEAEILAEYEAALPIVKISEETAVTLGYTAVQLLEMALMIAKHEQHNLGND